MQYAITILSLVHYHSIPILLLLTMSTLFYYICFYYYCSYSFLYLLFIIIFIYSLLFLLLLLFYFTVHFVAIMMHFPIVGLIKEYLILSYNAGNLESTSCIVCYVNWSITHSYRIATLCQICGLMDICCTQ